MKYKIISGFDPAGSPQWKEFVNNHPRGNIFHTPEFHSFIAEVPCYRPIAIAAFAGEAELVGVLTGVLVKEKGWIKGLLTSRLIIWGGPLTNGSDHSITDLLLDALIRNYGGKCIYIEFRNLFPMNGESNYFTRHGFRYADHTNFLVDTRDRQEVIKRISSGKNRQVKKSLKNEARILEEVSLDQVREFYLILQELYRTKVRKPLPAWEFFERFYHHPELGKYLLIEYKGAIVGGIMCLLFEKKTIYEWYIAGEDRKYEGIYPSVMATWAVIDYALNHGVSQFDFLGAGKPTEDYGVREFKSTFGGELVDNGRFTRVNSRLLYFVGKTGLSLMKRIRK